MSRSMLGVSCAAMLLLGLVGRLVFAEEGDSPFDGAGFANSSKEPTQTKVDHNAETRIKSILAKQLKHRLFFEEEPLSEVLSQLSEEYDLPIVFDNAALDELAISPDTELTINLDKISLKSVLNLIFKQPGLEDLCYAIDNEVLLISTIEEHNAYLVTKVYRIDDLVDIQEEAFNQSGNSIRYCDGLIEILVSCVEAPSWAENGNGPGEVQPLDPGMLVISQTPMVHEEIEKLFLSMRETKRQILADRGSHEKVSFREKPVTSGFLVSMHGDLKQETQDRIATAITSSVTWKLPKDSRFSEEDVWIEVLPNRVLVRHLPSVVEQVEIVLKDMRFLLGVPGFGGGRVGDSERKPKNGRF